MLFTQKQPQIHSTTWVAQNIYISLLGYNSASSRRSIWVYENPMTTATKPDDIHGGFSETTRSQKHTARSINPVEYASASPQLTQSVIFGPRLISVHRQDTCKGRQTWWLCERKCPYIRIIQWACEIIETDCSWCNLKCLCVIINERIGKSSWR